MTFLPATLNYFRLILNSKERRWSQGTDSYSELEIGYVMPTDQQKAIQSNKSFEQKMGDDFHEKIGKL